MNRTIVIMAGGTGGHVFPGLAVGHELAAQGWTVHWLGTPDRMEADLVPQHGFPISFINIRGVRNHGVLRKVAAPFQILKAISQAIKILKAIKPSVVLGMGGYASGPGGVAAKLLGIPVVLHEQNAAAGMTNRLLAKIANKILMGFSGAFPDSNKTRVVGNPVRKEFLQLAESTVKTYDAKSPLKILIVGGSLGARALNEVVPLGLSRLSNVEIRHQCGKGNLQSVIDLYHSLNKADASVTEFIADMASAYDWADLLICRAGALTVAEVATAGVPAVFVPLPHAVDDHQTKNAMSLASKGAALLLPQKDMTAESIHTVISQLLSTPEKLQEMARLSRAAAITDATMQVANVCKQISE